MWADLVHCRQCHSRVGGCGWYKKTDGHLAWWHTALVPILRRQRYTDICEFWDRQSYRETLSQNKTKTHNNYKKKAGRTSKNCLLWGASSKPHFSTPPFCGNTQRTEIYHVACPRRSSQRATAARTLAHKWRRSPCWPGLVFPVGKGQVHNVTPTWTHQRSPGGSDRLPSQVLGHHHKTVPRERAAYVGNLVDPARPLSGSTPSRVQSPQDSAKHRLKLS